MVTLSAKCQPHPKLGKERMLTDRRKVRAESYAAFGPDSGEEPDEVGPSQRSHRLPSRTVSCGCPLAHIISQLPKSTPTLCPP